MSEARKSDRERVRLAALLLALRTRGIHDRRVLAAIETVPRELFVAAPYRREAYEDHPLPIECGQTISAPSVVALMQQELDLEADHTVLEVGTGSGYAAAVLSYLCRKVVTLDRWRTLIELAQQRFETCRRTNIQAFVADGMLGWPRGAPYDRILVSAAAPELPAALAAQLAPDGVMVAPVGPEGGVQDLVRARRTAAGLVTEKLGKVRFVPLVAGVAARL